jgi:hypothetical protein
MAKRLASRLSMVAASALVMAGALSVGAAVVVPGAADAATCTASGIAAGATCTITGTLTITGGALTMTPPTSLTWASTITGTAQSVVDTTDTAYGVSDLTGSLAGWHVTATATQFTNGTATLPNTGTLVNTGSTTSITSGNKPTATCATVCILPTDTTTDPVAITTGGAATTIYDTAALTGAGVMTIGTPGANPVGWWLNVPPTVSAGAYTSTVTIGLISAP